MTREKITPEPLLKIAMSRWILKTIISAIELKIFTKISQGKTTLKKLSKSLNANEVSLEKFLNALVALDFLKKENNNYINTQLSDSFLVKTKPNYFGEFILMTAKSKTWDYLKDCVITNKPIGIDVEKEIFSQADFTKAMHSNAVGPAIVLSNLIDFSKYSNLLDVGGGSGAYSIVLTNKYPKLKATILELPVVCKVAKEFVNKLRNNKKIKIIAGDFLKDKFEKNYDVVLLSQILHSYRIKICKKLLKKIYNILPTNGLLIINDFLLNKNRTSPVYPALFNLIMMMEREGSTYTSNEIISWLKEIGFKDIEIKPLTGPHTAIIAKK